MSPRQLNLLQGTLDLLVLKALQRGPAHGYSVASWIRATSDKAFEIEDGALYTALHRMQKRGWLSSEWGQSENNRRARFYALTPEGRRQLDADSETWAAYADAVAKILASEASAG